MTQKHLDYFHELHEELKRYLEPQQIEKCSEAYFFAEKATASLFARYIITFKSHIAKLNLNMIFFVNGIIEQ